MFRQFIQRQSWLTARSFATLALDSYPLARIRNFSIVAHIDHGKSTLADRLLELTGTIDRHKRNSQVLDKLQVERERGITVKAQTASMFYKYNGEDYLINLIDTPGHVDFSYEVSRSLEACQGCLLLVDATKGVQAQTMSTFYAAFGADLTIIPVINKIDMQIADVPATKQQLQKVFDFLPDSSLCVSAKTGLHIETILPEVIRRIPPPTGNTDGPTRLRVFDSWFDPYRGVVCMVQVVDGKIKAGDKIESTFTGRKYEAVEVGIMHPEREPTTALHTGQVGYLIASMKTAKEARVGDTIFIQGSPVTPLPGLAPAKCMVYAGVYPVDAGQFDILQDSIAKLTLTDASISVQKETSAVLGMGFRCGFLGMLHMDVFMQRLEQEYNADVIATAPTVPYKVTLRDQTQATCDSPTNFPKPGDLLRIAEPYVRANIITPEKYLGGIITLCSEHRGEQKEMTFIDETRVILRYDIPLGETVATDFYDNLKSISHGYASFDYDEGEYRDSKIVLVDILLNGQPVDALSFIAHRDSAVKEGKERVRKLHEVIDRQMFDVAIQASMDGKVFARENLKALRKDVTAKCYGGDISRKRKLLDKQKEGKKKMRQVGNVELSQDAFLAVLRK